MTATSATFQHCSRTLKEPSIESSKPSESVIGNNIIWFLHDINCHLWKKVTKMITVIESPYLHKVQPQILQILAVPVQGFEWLSPVAEKMRFSARMQQQPALAFPLVLSAVVVASGTGDSGIFWNDDRSPPAHHYHLVPATWSCWLSGRLKVSGRPAS